mgnify:FL=1
MYKHDRMDIEVEIEDRPVVPRKELCRSFESDRQVIKYLTIFKNWLFNASQRTFFRHDLLPCFIFSEPGKLIN